MERIHRVFTPLFLFAFTFCLSIAAAGSAQSTAEIEQKIKALEDARKAGILSDEEFDRKKEELLGKGATPNAPSAQEKGKTYPKLRSSLWRADRANQTALWGC